MKYENVSNVIWVYIFILKKYIENGVGKD